MSGAESVHRCRTSAVVHRYADTAVHVAGAACSLGDAAADCVRRRAAGRSAEAGAGQGGVLSRPQLYALGDHPLRDPGRGASPPVAAGGRPVGVPAQQRHLATSDTSGRPCFQGGPRAHLDGASALVAGGLERYTVERHRVSVPRGARVPAYAGSTTSARPAAGPRTTSLPPGSGARRPDVAGVRAALWATSDKQAAYLLTLVVQQGLTTAELLGARRFASSGTGADGSSTPRSSTCSTARGRSASWTSYAELPPARAAAADASGAAARQGRTATTSTSTGRSSASWSRSTGSTTRGRRTSSATRCARTRSSSPATRSSGCRCWACGSSRTRSSSRSSEALRRRRLAARPTTSYGRA